MQYISSLPPAKSVELLTIALMVTSATAMHKHVNFYTEMLSW